MILYRQKSALSLSKNDFITLSVYDYNKRITDLRTLDQSCDRSQHDLSNRISCRYEGTQTTTISMIFAVFSVLSRNFVITKKHKINEVFVDE